MTRALEAFNRWFTSAAGVYQTLAAVVVIVVLEQFHVVNDHNGFWLLYWLTVYSAITQPALAYVARQGGVSEEKILHHIERLIEGREDNADG